MKRWMISAILAAGILSAGCSGSKNKTQSAPDSTVPAGLVTTTISLPQKIKQGSPVMLTMVVKNAAKTSIQFLKWYSPFESRFLNDYLEITDGNGAKVNYTGPMAKRAWPPPAEAYVSIESLKTMEASIDISTAYSLIKPGKYKVQFSGQFVDGLPASNTVSFEIE